MEYYYLGTKMHKLQRNYSIEYHAKDSMLKICKRIPENRVKLKIGTADRKEHS